MLKQTLIQDEEYLGPLAFLVTLIALKKIIFISKILKFRCINVIDIPLLEKQMNYPIRSYRFFPES